MANSPAPGALPDGHTAGHSPFAFFALVFALSIPFWAAAAVTERQLTPDLPVSSFIWLCPVVAAAILTWWQGGAAGLRALLRRAFDYDRIADKRWYLPAILLLPGVYLATYLLMRVSGWPLPSVQIPIVAGLAWFIGFFVAGQGEELGWSGYAIDPLQHRLGALGAGLVLGTVWVAFHLVPLLQGHRAAAWIAWWAIATLALRVLFTWLYNNTGGSVFATVLFHATGNLAQIGPFFDYGPGGYPLAAQRIAALLLSALVVVVVAIWGPRTLARNRLA